MPASLPALSASTLLPLALFAFASSITPGPNNVMLTASGANFGFRRTVPHLLGISLGVALMLLLVGAGLGGLFSAWPALYTALQAVGALYLLWLAWKVAHAGEVRAGQAVGRPLSFWQAAAFQWVNPKAWLMTVGIVAAYTPREDFAAHLLLATVVLAGVNLPCISVWAWCGSALGPWLRAPKALRRFNHCMAALLLMSLYPLAQSLLAWL